MPAHLLGRNAGGRVQCAQLDAKILVKRAHPLQRAMDVNGVMMAAAAQFGDDALRLAQRIGADEDAAVGIGVERGEQPIHLAAGVGMAKHRQAEGGFGHEDIAGDGFEG